MLTLVLGANRPHMCLIWLHTKIDFDQFHLVGSRANFPLQRQRALPPASVHDTIIRFQKDASVLHRSFQYLVTLHLTGNEGRMQPMPKLPFVPLEPVAVN